MPALLDRPLNIAPMQVELRLAKSADPGQMVIEGVASAKFRDVDGDIVDPNAVASSIPLYMAPRGYGQIVGGPVLYHHKDALPPLGRTVKIWVMNGLVHFRALLDPCNPMAVQIYNQIKSGIVHFGVSLGGAIKAWIMKLINGLPTRWITDIRLDELSITPNEAVRSEQPTNGLYSTYVMAKSAGQGEPTIEDLIPIMVGDSFLYVNRLGDVLHKASRSPADDRPGPELALDDDWMLHLFPDRAAADPVRDELAMAKAAGLTAVVIGLDAMLVRANGDIVKLVKASQLGLFGGDFEESEHPRDKGKFAEKGKTKPKAKAFDKAQYFHQNLKERLGQAGNGEAPKKPVKDVSNAEPTPAIKATNPNAKPAMKLADIMDSPPLLLGDVAFPNLHVQAMRGADADTRRRLITEAASHVADGHSNPHEAQYFRDHPQAWYTQHALSAMRHQVVRGGADDTAHKALYRDLERMHNGHRAAMNSGSQPKALGIKAGTVAVAKASQMPIHHEIVANLDAMGLADALAKSGALDPETDDDPVARMRAGGTYLDGMGQIHRLR